MSNQIEDPVTQEYVAEEQDSSPSQKVNETIHELDEEYNLRTSD
tara:strand:+ start:163 stop:294 length:132 start_codon:yes stop_codon:yes gene_type:complete